MAAEADDISASNSSQAIVSRRSPDFAVADNKEVCRVAGRDETLRVQHQCLIESRFDSLDTGGDAVQFGMSIESGVLYIGMAPPNVNGEDPKSTGQQFRVRFLEFCNDDDGWAANGDSRVLVRCGLDTAGDHQTDTDPFAHPVCREQPVNTFGQLDTGKAQFEVQCLGTFKEPVHVLIEKGHAAVEDTQSLPDAITQDKA